MKLKPGFLLHNVGGAAVLVPTGEAAKHFRGIANLNETAAFIVERLQSETTEAAVVEAVLERYEAGRADAERSVRSVVAKLESIHAIE